MDDATKKRLKAHVRDQERKAALASLPLQLAELEAMFDMLEVELGAHDCDHTRRLTQAWLDARGHDVDAVFAWLDTQGGYCDCEVLANVEQNVDEAKNASRTPPNEPRDFSSKRAGHGVENTRRCAGGEVHSRRCRP